MANYSLAYIPKYAELAKPLYDLIDLKDVPEKLLYVRERTARNRDGNRTLVILLIWEKIYGLFRP